MRQLSIRTQHHGDDRPGTRACNLAFVTTAPVDARRARDDDAPRVTRFADVARVSRRSRTHLRRAARTTPARTESPRRCDGARLATRARCGNHELFLRAPIPCSSASTRCSTGSGNACRRQSPVSGGMNRGIMAKRQPLATTASFSGGHVMSITVKITPNDRGQPARQTRGCRAAFHRRRARRLEADRLRRLGATRRQRPQRHVPGAPVLRQW